MIESSRLCELKKDFEDLLTDGSIIAAGVALGRYLETIRNSWIKQEISFEEYTDITWKYNNMYADAWEEKEND